MGSSFAPPPSLLAHPVLIGTPETVAALAGQLAVTHLLPDAVGCVLVGDRPSHSDVAGIRVLGTVDDLPHLHLSRPVSCAIISLPQRERALLRRVRDVVRSLGVPERLVPTLADLLESPPAHSPLAPGPSVEGAALSELLGRTPYGIDPRLVRGALESKRVLITGAGGSIGSELCRIAATFRPSLLILMERSENALFEIDRQIARRFPDVPRKAVLHDVVDDAGTLRIVTGLRPHAVFHAAAHKHVPLMEDHPSHAISNNVFGTRSIVDASLAAQAERFVMISTDKAVNPSSAMGATKRLAELYVQWAAQQQPTRRATTNVSIVRFGNVLGSACSVLPIWTQQLVEGGPLTVTDPRMTRYFMTIPEAASLVIQAGAIDQGGTAPRPVVYVLDMGEPVRILDLALRFARLHGFEPNVRSLTEPARTAQAESAIDVVLTGIRPGEKLHEELSYRAEALTQTPYPGILALRDDAAAETLDIPAMIADLASHRAAGDPTITRAAIRRYIAMPDGVGLTRAPAAA